MAKFVRREMAGRLTVEDMIDLSQASDRSRDAAVRQHVSYAVMALFGAVNIAALVLLYFMFQADRTDLAAKLIAPADRIVNAQVLMTLLGATTVQLGTVAVIMTRFVFREAG